MQDPKQDCLQESAQPLLTQLDLLCRVCMERLQMTYSRDEAQGEMRFLCNTLPVETLEENEMTFVMI